MGKKIKNTMIEKFKKFNFPQGEIWNLLLELEKEHQNYYVAVKLKNKDYGWFKISDNKLTINKEIKIISHWDNADILYNPTRIRKIDNNYYISQMSQRIVKFDVDFNFKNLIGYWAKFTDTNIVNGYVSLNSFYLDLPQNTLYVLSSAHILRAFNFDSMTKKFDIGVYNLPGDAQFNKLYNATDVIIHGDKIIISSRNGKGTTDSIGQGFVCRYKIADGSLIDCPLSYTKQGLSELKEITYPNKMFLKGTDIYICYRNKVAVFDIETFNFKTQYYLPKNKEAISVYVTSNGEVFVATVTSIVVFAENGSKINEFGFISYENFKDAPNMVGGFSNIKDVMVDEDKNTVIILDYGNNRIQEIPTDIVKNCSKTIKLDLEDVTDKKYKSSFPYEIDKNSWTINVNNKEFFSQQNFKEIYLLY